MQNFFNVSSGQSIQTNRVVAAIKTTNSNSVESVPSARGEILLASDEEGFLWESEEEDNVQQVAGPGQHFFSSSDDDKLTGPKVLDMDDVNSGKSEGLFMPSSDSDLEFGMEFGREKPKSGGAPSSSLYPVRRETPLLRTFSAKTCKPLKYRVCNQPARIVARE